MAFAIFFPDPLPYAEGLRIQHALHEARRNDTIPDTVMLLQHRPVITLGRRGRTQHLLVREEDLKARGIDLFEASRGGDVTFHGPGQVVIYPIMRLGVHGTDSHGYLNNLEEIAIRTCARYGVEAWRREGKSGAWTASGKIAAIGFKLQRWVTLHGMSFNVEQELAGFDLIVPCGLAGEPVASLRKILGANCPAPDDVAATLLEHFELVCGRTCTRLRYGDPLPPGLSCIEP
jgi:lipoate-protein ligase B